MHLVTQTTSSVRSDRHTRWPVTEPLSVEGAEAHAFLSAVSGARLRAKIARAMPIPPTLGEPSFECPYCHVHAQQLWSVLALGELDVDDFHRYVATAERDEFVYYLQRSGDAHSETLAVEEKLKAKVPTVVRVVRSKLLGRNLINMSASTCTHCSDTAIWCDRNLVLPSSGLAPPPHVDIFADLLVDYREAMEVFARSPRSAAALLRLVIQKLCRELGAPEKRIDDDIQWLIDEDRIGTAVKLMLDSVRVIGNNAVHPGHLDLRDDHTLVYKLFQLVNLIVEQAITQPKMIAQIHNGLPPNALKGIDDRAARGKAQREKKSPKDKKKEGD